MKSISLHLLMNVSVSCLALSTKLSKTIRDTLSSANFVHLSVCDVLEHAISVSYLQLLEIRVLRLSMRAFHIIPENIYFHCKKNNHTS